MLPTKTGKSNKQLKLVLVRAVYAEDLVKQDKMYQECKGQTCWDVKMHISTTIIDTNKQICLLANQNLIKCAHVINDLNGT